MFPLISDREEGECSYGVAEKGDCEKGNILCAMASGILDGDEGGKACRIQVS